MILGFVYVCHKTNSTIVLFFLVMLIADLPSRITIRKHSVGI